MLDQRRRRWADVVQMLDKYFVLVGYGIKYLVLFSCINWEGIRCPAGVSSILVMYTGLSNHMNTWISQQIPVFRHSPFEVVLTLSAPFSFSHLCTV